MPAPRARSRRHATSEPTVLYASHLSNTAPQCSHSLSLSQMGRLDARFLRLPGITRPGIVRAVVQDSAALLGAHLSYRCGAQVVTSRPDRHSGRFSSSQSTAEPLRFGPDMAAVRRQV